MKASNLLTLLIALLCCLPATAEKKPRYKLVWQDHFRSSRIDTTSWEKIPRGQSDWDRHMSSVDSLYAIRNGCLVLRGVVNRTETSDTARYITGGLYTRGKRHISYGKVEVRARLGRAQGAWPAIWMLPFTAQWPMGGEIDIMEHLNHDFIAYQTIHTHYTHDPEEIIDPETGKKHYNIEERRKASLIAVEQMEKIVKEKDAALFLVGDLNCSLADGATRNGPRSLEPLTEYMWSAREDAHSYDGAISFNGFTEYKNGKVGNIDHIFYRGAEALDFVTVNSPDYGVTYISDHYPVMCGFEI